MKLLARLLLLVGLFWATQSQAAIAFTANNPMQDNNNSSSFSTGTIALNWTNTSASTFLFAYIWLASSATLTAVSNTATDSWTIVGPTSAGAGFSGWLVYAQNPSSHAGSDYLTLTFTGGPSAIGCYTVFGELTGVATSSPLSTSNSAQGSASAPTVNLTSVVAGSAIVAATINSSAVAPGAGSGYTLAGSSNNATYGYSGEYNLSSGSGTVTVNFTGSATWNLFAAAFLPVGGSCTHNFWSSTGAFSQPNGTTGSYWSISGAWATPNCTSGSYWRSDGTWNSN